MVTLARQRRIRVTVFRQETGGFNTGPEGIAGISLIGGTSKFGSGHVVELPPYENDVMNALARTGGLPGLDAYDDVVVLRKPSVQDRAILEGRLQKKDSDGLKNVLARMTCPVVRIPLRVKPNEIPPVRQEDITLQRGDVVFLEERALDVFYTGGILPTGEHVLPRDRDLDVIEAISLVQGPLVSGNVLVNNTGFVQSPVVSRIGQPSASLLVVLRRLPGGDRIPIRVDLNRALRDSRERLRVMPKDVLILQETPGEAVLRYLADTFNFSFTYNLFTSSRAQGTASGSFP